MPDYPHPRVMLRVLLVASTMANLAGAVDTAKINFEHPDTSACSIEYSGTTVGLDIDCLINANVSCTDALCAADLVSNAGQRAQHQLADADDVQQN
jgi:hypothetical protein